MAIMVNNINNTSDTSNTSNTSNTPTTSSLHFTYSSDIVKNYEQLPNIISSYIQITGISANIILDMCYAICLSNWDTGSNRRSLSIDSFNTSDDKTWSGVLNILGTEPTNMVNISALPRVQKQRVILDALILLLGKNENTNPLIHKYVDKLDDGITLLTIDSSKVFSWGAYLHRVSNLDSDTSEDGLRPSYECIFTIFDWLTGYTDKDTASQDTASQDDTITGIYADLKSILGYYNAKTSNILMIEGILPKSLEPMGTHISGVTWVDDTDIKDESIIYSTISSLTSALIQEYLKIDSLSVRLIIKDISTKVIKSGANKLPLYLSSDIYSYLRNKNYINSGIGNLFLIKEGTTNISDKRIRGGLLSLIALLYSPSSNSGTLIKEFYKLYN